MFELDWFFALGIITLLLKMSLLPEFTKFEQHKYHKLKFHNIPPSNPIKPWQPLPKRSFNSSSPPTFIHLHIPKTAGSQFKRLLASSTMKDYTRPFWYRNINSWFPAVRDYSWAAAGCAKTRQNVKKKSCINGGVCKEKTGNELDSGTHCGMSEMEDCILKKEARLDYEKLEKWTYISSVREPVNRVLSEYYWWRGKGCLTRKNSTRLTRAWTFELCLKNWNLTKWILHPDNSAHNRQFKSLVYFKNLTIPLLENNDSNCNNMDGYKERDFWRKIKIYNDMRDSGLLERLLETIEEKYFFIGLTENMEDSTEAALKLMRLPFNDQIKQNVHFRISGGVGHKSHVHDSWNKVTDYQRELIKQKNWLDVQLYEYVKNKLNATLDFLNNNKVGYRF